MTLSSRPNLQTRIKDTSVSRLGFHLPCWQTWNWITLKGTWLACSSSVVPGVTLDLIRLQLDSSLFNNSKMSEPIIPIKLQYWHTSTVSDDLNTSVLIVRKVGYGNQDPVARKQKFLRRNKVIFNFTWNSRRFVEGSVLQAGALLYVYITTESFLF